MLRRITKNTDVIEQYIGNCYYKCLYLFLDFRKYGVDTEGIEFYFQEEDNEVKALMLCYYDSMHIYSRNNDLNYDEIINFIKERKPIVICAEKEIISYLHSVLDNYDAEYGWVRELSVIDNSYENVEYEKVSSDEFVEVSKLICNDDIGKAYEVGELARQLEERNKSGYGRNYIIKLDGEIATHAGTGAEEDEMAVMNYVITNPKYRGKGLATKLVGKLSYDLIKEGKKIYLINYTNESSRLYDKLGFIISCEYGKLSIRK